MNAFNLSRPLNAADTISKQNSNQKVAKHTKELCFVRC